MEAQAGRSTESWTLTSAMSNEELLALTKRFVDEPKPFPNWIPIGNQLHVMLDDRGLLHD